MNIYDQIKSNNVHNGNKVALSISMDNKEQRTYTYSELDCRINCFAKILSEAGLTPSDRVALIAENSPEWIIGFLAIMKIQCTAVLIDASLACEDILAI